MKTTLIITILSVVVAVGVTIAITTALNDRDKKKAIEISKKAAVQESKFQDSLRFERGVRLSLEKMFKAQGDSLRQIRKEKQRVRVVIQNIHPIAYTKVKSDSILRKRYGY